jgi:hypothetical protein
MSKFLLSLTVISFLLIGGLCLADGRDHNRRPPPPPRWDYRYPVPPRYYPYYVPYRHYDFRFDYDGRFPRSGGFNFDLRIGK